MDPSHPFFPFWISIFWIGFRGFVISQNFSKFEDKNLFYSSTTLTYSTDPTVTDEEQNEARTDPLNIHHGFPQVEKLIPFNGDGCCFARG